MVQGEHTAPRKVRRPQGDMVVELEKAKSVQVEK